MKTRKFLPNQFEFLGKKVFIAQNHPMASDDNPGTAAQPFKTISAGVENLQPADHVYIDTGVYREEVPLVANGHYYVPNQQVHFHALDEAEVYLKGSDVFDVVWESLGANLWRADLPACLFEDAVYNPYQLSLVLNDEDLVRPCKDETDLPETRGQIYVDDEAYEQLRSVEAVKACEKSFVVTADGRALVAQFPAGVTPADCAIELIVRRRCIQPTFDGEVHIQVHGLCVEHAAEPGPFCKSRHVGLMRSGGSGVKIEKRFCWPGAVGVHCNLIEGQPAYVSRDSHTMVASFFDETTPTRYPSTESLNVASTDGGKTWHGDDATQEAASTTESAYSYTVDEKAGVLMRHWRDDVHGIDPHGAFGNIGHNVMFQFSRDSGQSWSEPKLIDDTKIYCFSILPLEDGSYVWPYTFNTMPNAPISHSKFCTLIGRLNDDGSDIKWRQGGDLEVSVDESAHGLDEPSLAQFADGRLIAFFRQGSKLASQERPGITSVKLWSVSNDGGTTWSKAEPLCYDDGKYVYSPRAYHIALRSIKNGKVYILMNISDRPCFNCDPRTHLYLVEINPTTLRVDRDKAILVEGVHPEHHHKVRFSNFQVIQERNSRNPLVFMILGKCQYCPIWDGYDMNMYRYEIRLPQ